MKKSNKLIGALFVLVGLFCLAYPIFTSISIDIITGACFFVGAIFSFFNLPQVKGAWDKAMYFVIATLYALGGFYMLTNPLEGTIALTIAIGALFLAQSIFMFIYWNKVKNKNPAASMILLNAVITIVLAFLILTNLASSLWFIGVLVGINLLFTGISIFLTPPVASND